MAIWEILLLALVLITPWIIVIAQRRIIWTYRDRLLLERRWAKHKPKGD